MDFMKLAKDRFSVRNFSSRPIEEEKLQQILEAGRIAPTAANLQPQKVYVLKSREAIEKINALSKCIYGAPTVLMVGYDKNVEWQNPKEKGVSGGEEDASIVATHMMLAAWEQGIGSCWVNMFSPTETAKAFGLPESVRLVLLMPIGYAAEDSKPHPKWHAERKPLAETVAYL